MEIFNAIMNLRRQYEDISFLEALTDGGSLFVLLIAIGLLSVPIALVVILRVRLRAWSLLVSMAPFAMAALACNIHSLSIYGYMSGPELNTVLGDIALQIQIFWLGTATTLLLAFIALITPQRSRTIHPDAAQ